MGSLANDSSGVRKATPQSAATDRERHAELVHKARKAIKRMRTLALLLRSELGEREFARIDDSLRTAGRRLAGARDAEVRLATLERLRRRHPEALADVSVQRLLVRLRHERDEASEPARELPTLAEIGELRGELTRLKLVERDFETLEPGLRRIYRDGRRRYRRVERRRTDDVEALHDWRKRVKGLYYALDMLGGANGAKCVRRSTRLAERLGETLGEDHDLWMLATYVSEHKDEFEGREAVRSELSGLIERRQKRLRRRAFRTGTRLYQRKPRAFVRRMRKGLARS